MFRSTAVSRVLPNSSLRNAFNKSFNACHKNHGSVGMLGGFASDNVAFNSRNNQASSSSTSSVCSSAIFFSAAGRSQRRQFHGTSTPATTVSLRRTFNPVTLYIRFCNQCQMTAAIVTSIVLWSLGDLLTQKMEHNAKLKKKKEEEMDAADKDAGSGSASSSSSSTNALSGSGSSDPNSAVGYFDFVHRKRLVATAFFGVSVIGVGGFYWYRFLDYLVTKRLGITPRTSGFAKFTAAKLGIEFAIWHPVTLALFWMMVGTYADGKTPTEVLHQLRTDLPTALAADISLWLPIDILNFRFTPVHMQVIVVNLGSLLEAVLLSYLHGSSDGGHGH